MWARQAFGAPLRPLFVASILSPASAQLLEPCDMQTYDFSILPSIVKKVEISAISEISAKKIAISIIGIFFSAGNSFFQNGRPSATFEKVIVALPCK